MTLLADALPDSAPLPRDVLVRVRESRRAANAAEVEVLELALEWAHANPGLPGEDSWEPVEAPSWLEETTELLDDEEREWIDLPSLRWDAPAAFAAANDMTTTAGKSLIRDVLVLAHRAPHFWEKVTAGKVPAWRARKVAQALLAQPADVCRYVDREITARLEESGAIGPVVLDRLVDEAMLRLHSEQRELEQLLALDARYVAVDPASINHTGIGAMDARADWADLSAFDDTVGRVAEVLAHLPEHQHDSLDVRRSIALGILADPSRAQALLDGDLDAKPTRVRDLVATLDLGEGHLFGVDPVMTDADQRAHLDQVIRSWAGRPDINLVVKPIRAHRPAADCDDHDIRARITYSPSLRERELLAHRTPTCVHPHCNRPARQCDYDHIKPFDPDDPEGGVTCVDCNLAPLCRHHHRLKTLAGWRYWKLGPPGAYLWQDPHGLLYLRTRDGTRSLD
jgi:hypothetical protein